MEIKNWADFGALTKEELDAFTPEELEALKTSVADNEAKLADERKAKDDELAKAKEIAENQRIRAEKAEKEAKKGGGGEPPKEPQELTRKELLYLAKADIHEDDNDTVIEWAKFRNISVKDAHGELKGVLATKAEERRSAQATQTKGARGATAATAEDLLSQASKGQLPETDEGIEALAAAEMARKIAQSKR